MTAELDEARALLDAQDTQGLLRHLRQHAGGFAAADLAALVGGAARLAGFDDLAAAADRLAREPAEPQARYDFGYACVERGASFLAVGVLTELLREYPDASGVLTELVSALEDEERHAEAVAVLAEREARLRDWPDRYLLAYNALMAGDLPRAEAVAARLPAPEDESWHPAHARIGRMLDRAAAARRVSALDGRDLRGWQFALAGTVLGIVSPHGYDDGMNGRHAYLQDDYQECRRGLERLRLVLDAAGRRPRAVGLLPDRSSQALGLAAARLLGLPAERFDPRAPEALVVAYDLNELGESAAELVPALYERAPGQILVEHASCWTSPPPVSADYAVLLHQVNVPPWGPRLRLGEDGGAVRDPADERPAGELAEEVLRAALEPAGPGGTAPGDSDRELAAFTAAVAGRWLTGPRERVRSAGPVRSSRFA
ncbi:hypothetical protein [Allonocardiopsis opalescens]|uniref:Tetratricopeptide repeat protein n=1 Tax=Allonocardiopsis opalescens TaxID=1144618 RepID=A0A2T0Q0E4_9ACTN|nr:hypothetical protein [Allonocardiopsis opalescens]PRX97254.1 hypothetical protein CLV72_106291 [Allonocardiopsis opalescens]